MKSAATSFSVLLTAFLFSGLLFSTELQAGIIKNLTAPEVKNMMEKGDAVVIHTLSGIEFEIQHIPSSINIPVIDVKTTDKLPQDKNIPLIFYCMGIR